MRTHSIVGSVILLFTSGLGGMLAFGEDPAPPPPPYADAEVSNSSDGQHTLVLVTVGGLGDKRLKDLHLDLFTDGTPPSGENPMKAPQPKKTPIDVKDGRGNVVAHAAVKTDPKTGHVSLVLDTPLPEGQYYFDIPWATTGAAARGAPNCKTRFRCTTNGQESYSEADVISGPIVVPFPKVPGHAIVMHNVDPQPSVTCAVGMVTQLNVDVTGGPTSDIAFQLYTSLTLNPDYADILHIGIDSTTHPIPEAWGLAFSESVGVLNEDGHPTSPLSVTVPNTPSLAGQVFYAVIALGPPSNPWLVSDPVAITIVPGP